MITNLKAYNQIINIGSDKPYSVNYLAETVLKTMDAKNKIVHLPPRKEVVHAYSSHQKMKEIFGCETKICLEEGVKMMADWARRVGSKKSKEFCCVLLTNRRGEVSYGFRVLSFLRMKYICLASQAKGLVINGQKLFCLTMIRVMFYRLFEITD